MKPSAGWVGSSDLAVEYALLKVADTVQDMKARGRISARGWKVWTMRLTEVNISWQWSFEDLLGDFLILTFNTEMLIASVGKNDWLVGVPLWGLVPLKELMDARHAGCVLHLVFGMVIPQSIMHLPPRDCAIHMIRVLVFALSTHPKLPCGCSIFLGRCKGSPSP